MPIRISPKLRKLFWKHTWFHTWVRLCKHYRQCEVCEKLEVYVEDRAMGCATSTWLAYPLSDWDYRFRAEGHHAMGQVCGWFAAK